MFVQAKVRADMTKISESADVDAAERFDPQPRPIKYALDVA